ncbi:MAG: PQQ-binding-like beta-propeller repeat protein [Vicinamibacterales bacterium]
MRSDAHRWIRIGTAVIAVTAGATLLAQTGPAPAPITDQQLLDPAPGDWVSYRRTYDVTGFSPLTQIDRANVRQLQQVWSYSMRDNRRWLASPIIANGLMYVTEGSGRVVAFNAVTGDVVWIHERQLPADVSISEAFPRARGVSIYRDRIYWGTPDSYLVALNAWTGKLLWEVKTADYRTGTGHAHPPLIAEGIVFLGNAGGDNGAPGRFRAFDAESGKLLWTINTAPEPGDPGYDTWTARDVPPLGAAPWHTISYDPALHLVYFSTGQPSPWSTALRGPGDALYANTVIAADARTGKIRWHFQLNPADDWDRAAYENMLVDLPINGRMRKALIQTGKIGWGVVLDRETGEFLHAFKTAYDNVVTGWTPKGRPIINPASIPTPADVVSGKMFEVCPHLHGARNVQSPSYSPLTHLYYLGINNSCMDAKVVDIPYVVGRAYMGVTQKAKLAPGYDYVGEFVAFDPVTGKRAWTYRGPGGAAMTASALATAGGVVFGGTVDRQFFALDTDTGALLWETRLSGDVSGAPVTFAVDGRQYVAIAAGGRGGPTTSFAPLTNVDLPQGTGVVSVFALPPSTPLQTRRGRSAPVMLSRSGVPPAAPTTASTAAASTAAPARSVSPGAGGIYTSAQAQRGEQRFQQACSTCHTIDEQAGSLRSKWGTGTLADLYKVISTTMPQNSPGSLSSDDYASIIALYLRQTGHSPGAVELPSDSTQLMRLRVSPQ